MSHANKGIFTLVDEGHDHILSLVGKRMRLYFDSHQANINKVENVKDYHVRKRYGILRVFKR